MNRSNIIGNYSKKRTKTKKIDLEIIEKNESIHFLRLGIFVDKAIPSKIALNSDTFKGLKEI